jgi:enoyl-CoA hydratase/carnithine racemase
MRSVTTERDGAIYTITIDRPQRRNALTYDGWVEFLGELRKPRPGARVVVLTGAGEHFCAGADLSEPVAGAEHPIFAMSVLAQACLALHRMEVPTIARVDGSAFGAGANLALMCDFVVASDRARFGEVFVKLGLSLDFGGSWLLPRLIGLRKARELALLGEVIEAPEAAAIGLIHAAVPPAELDATAANLAHRLGAVAPVATRMTKRLLDNSSHVTIEQALEDEARAQAIAIATNDLAEAVTAFREKRDPIFTGR